MLFKKWHYSQTLKFFCYKLRTQFEKLLDYFRYLLYSSITTNFRVFIIMMTVEVSKCNGDVKLAIKRLKRTCDKNGLPRRWREMEYHTKPTTQRRKDKAAAVKRHLKKRAMFERRLEENSFRSKRGAKVPFESVIDANVLNSLNEQNT
jgi:small subunit ribosomal protein S21